MAGFAPAVAAGSAQLRNVRAEVRGLNTPIEIGLGELEPHPDAISLPEIFRSYASTHWGGTVRRLAIARLGLRVSVRPCSRSASTEILATGSRPHPAKRAWYRLLNPAANTRQVVSPLLTILARGSLQVGRFEMKKVAATQITTQVGSGSRPDYANRFVAVSCWRVRTRETGSSTSQSLIRTRASASNPAVHETLVCRYAIAAPARW